VFWKEGVDGVFLRGRGPHSENRKTFVPMQVPESEPLVKRSRVSDDDDAVMSDRSVAVSRYYLSDPHVRSLVIVVLSSVFATMWMCSMLTAFFPQVASDQFGISNSIVGIIFAMFPAVVAVFSPLVAYLASKIGRMPILLIGMVCQIAGTVAFGLCFDAITFCFARALQGLGATMLQVAGIALLSSNIRNLDDALAMQEILSGFGYMVGPPTGAILYANTSFFQTFFISSLVIVAIFCYILFEYLRDRRKWQVYDEERVVKGSHDIAENDADGPLLGTSTQVTQDTSAKELIPLKKVTNATFISCSIACGVLFLVMGAFDPTLGPHIQELLNVNQTLVGIIFVYPAVAYMIFAGSASWVVRKITAKNTLVIGLFVTCLGMACVGPLPGLDAFDSLTASWIFMFLGGTGFGLGVGWGYVPLVPMMRDAVDKAALKYSDRYIVEEQHLSNFVSAVYNSASSIGQVVGPLFAGLSMDHSPKRRQATCRDPIEENCYSGISWTYAFLSILSLSCCILVQLTVTKEENPVKVESVEESHPELKVA
jgi:MFS family permease